MTAFDWLLWDQVDAARNNFPEAGGWPGDAAKLAGVDTSGVTDVDTFWSAGKDREAVRSAVQVPAVLEGPRVRLVTMFEWFRILREDARIKGASIWGTIGAISCRCSAKEGRLTTSVRQMSRDTGITQRILKRNMDELRGAGYLQLTSGGSPSAPAVWMLSVPVAA